MPHQVAPRSTFSWSRLWHFFIIIMFVNIFLYSLFPFVKRCCVLWRRNKCFLFHSILFISSAREMRQISDRLKLFARLAGIINKLDIYNCLRLAINQSWSPLIYNSEQRPIRPLGWPYFRLIWPPLVGPFMFAKECVSCCKRCDNYLNTFLLFLWHFCSSVAKIWFVLAF